MNNMFVNAVREEMNHTFTENGARAKNTSGDDCLDFFSTAGSIRKADFDRKYRLFSNAFLEDPLSALRILFYVRDVRGGLGERDTFRTILHQAAKDHTREIRTNLWAIPFYGRWDDLYELIDTPCEAPMWKFMEDQLKMDLENMTKEKPVSLIAKWVKRGDESSQKAHALGILTANKLGYSVYDFKRLIARLRKYIDVVEAKMSTQRWDEIDYTKVPSRASMLYRNAFKRHDEDRYEAFMQKVVNGEEKINTATLFPYDIIEKVWNNYKRGVEDDALQVMWDNLPDYVGKGFNAMVIADTSGSMMCDGGRPFYSAVALAVYFAQRNRSAFHNLWMTFSRNPKYQHIKGNTLYDIIHNFDTSDWDMNTNLEAALRLILQTAVDNLVPDKDMPKSLIIVSDMEIDDCEDSGWSFYDYMKETYAEHGYDIPNIVFWNVDSRNDVFHADKNRKGVQLVSGHSSGTFKSLMGAVGMTPIEFMLSIINSDRYQPIQLPEEK